MTSHTIQLDIDALTKGATWGPLQSAGVMQVLPLIEQEAPTKMEIVSPSAGIFSTSDYGSMVFNNPTSHYMLIPCHAGYVLNQAAQDHAMSHAGLVSPQETRRWNTAMCIQSSQGGYIDQGQYEMLILPLRLRPKALEVRHEKHYGKLWDAISNFNCLFGLHYHGHLEYFTQAFQRQLEQFAAEFECLPHQVGAAILIDGQLVGLERTPSPQYWQTIWKPLIRECYGSYALEVSRRGTSLISQSLLQLGMGIDRAGTLEELEAFLQQNREELQEQMIEKVQSSLPLLPAQLEEGEENDLHPWSLYTTGPQRKHNQLELVGQTLCQKDGKEVVYASLVLDTLLEQ